MLMQYYSFFHCVFTCSSNYHFTLVFWRYLPIKRSHHTYSEVEFIQSVWILLVCMQNKSTCANTFLHCPCSVTELSFEIRVFETLPVPNLTFIIHSFIFANLLILVKLIRWQLILSNMLPMEIIKHVSERLKKKLLLYRSSI